MAGTVLYLGALAIGYAAPSLRPLRSSHYGVMIGTKECNVADYGAKGDGNADDTNALQRAINDCGAGGGGVVRIPSKTQAVPNGGARFLSFALVINASNLELNLESGATLLINDNRGKWNDHCHNCDFISASGVQHIAVTGEGTIDGQGKNWWKHRDDFRPHTIQFSGVTMALIESITIIDPPNHCMEIFADHAELSHVSVQAPPSTGTSNPSHNTDAVDVHGSPFFIHDCHFDTGDDNVAVHSSNVLVENCKFGNGHGASIGSLCDAQLSNITFRGIEFQGTTNGARIKVREGCSGHVSDVTYQDLTMDGVENPIDISMHYDSLAGTIQQSSGFLLERVTFKNITSKNSKYAGNFFCTKQSPCKDIALQSVDLGTSDWTCRSPKVHTNDACDCFSETSGHTKDVKPSPCLRS